jgi:hypothetical protein
LRAARLSGRRDPLAPAPVLVRRRTGSRSTPDPRRIDARFEGALVRSGSGVISRVA